MFIFRRLITDKNLNIGSTRNLENLVTEGPGIVLVQHQIHVRRAHGTILLYLLAYLFVSLWIFARTTDQMKNDADLKFYTLFRTIDPWGG